MARREDGRIRTDVVEPTSYGTHLSSTTSHHDYGARSHIQHSIYSLAYSQSKPTIGWEARPMRVCGYVTAIPLASSS